MSESIRQIFFDTETTGIGQGHRILELGAVESIDRVLTGNDFHHIINPERDIDEVAMKIHGITFEKVQDKPTFAEVVEDFLAYIKDAEVIIHNASFDVKMVNYELQLLSQSQGKDYGQLSDYCHITDSLALARKVLKSGKHSLDALCDHYRVDRSGRSFHSALLDCSLLFQVYVGLTSGQKELFAENKKQNNHQDYQEKPLADYQGIDLPHVVVLPQEQQRHEEFIRQLALKGS